MSKRIFSKKREAIYQTIVSTPTHPSAEWVYNQLKTEYPELSVGTVYRNISVFKDMGLVKTVGVVNGQERFDAHVAPHPHLICRACGGVTDLSINIPTMSQKLYNVLNMEYGIKVDDYALTLYGLCRNCCADNKKVQSSSFDD
ncbi:MAG: transcriptional repressor [Acutalibacteraceae bacterium]